MFGTKAVETIDFGAAFARNASALPRAYHGREAATAARIAGQSAAVAPVQALAQRMAERAQRAERPAQVRTSDAAERAAMLELIPALRAFAISLTGSADSADDLVQETLVRAISHIDTFQAGTNMGAWLFTILRNLVFSQTRKKRRDMAYRLTCAQQSWKTHAEQHGKMELMQMRQALMQISADQREAIVLVGASGFTYEEAAEVIGCAVGTVKSRVSRARDRLVKLMQVNASDRFGPQGQDLAVVA
jgi:RNA polymerase sigma-70 factor, ECF subfamily